MTRFQIGNKLRQACSKAKYAALETFGIGQVILITDGSRFGIRKTSLKLATAAIIGTPLTLLGLVNNADAAIISNGTIQLGVNKEGNLGVPGGTPSSGSGTTNVGLRFLPTNADGTAPGCLCEGWGVADADSGITGYASIYKDGGAKNLDQVSFIADSIRATSVVSLDDTLKVTHDFVPVEVTPYLYKATVTIENTGKNPVNDLRYRRVFDWDIEPTQFNEFVTVKTGGASNVLFTSNDGFASANPLVGVSDLGSTGEFVDAGPKDQGALFDFGFGKLAAGAKRTFDIFYGAAPDEAKALAALAEVGANQVYSLGQPNVIDGATTGKPNTFMFAFKGVGEPPKEEVPEPITILGSLAAGGVGIALRRKQKQRQKETE